MTTDRSVPPKCWCGTATTAIAMQLDKKTVRYADTFTIEGQITATLSSGYKGYVENAPLALQRRFPGGVWAMVGRTTSTSYDGTFRFASVKAFQNASYRMVYAGETRTYDGTEVVLQPSTSPERGIRVARNFDLGSVKRNGGIIFNGRVAPSYKGKIVQVRAEEVRPLHVGRLLEGPDQQAQPVQPVGCRASTGQLGLPGPHRGEQGVHRLGQHALPERLPVLSRA